MATPGHPPGPDPTGHPSDCARCAANKQALRELGFDPETMRNKSLAELKREKMELLQHKFSFDLEKDFDIDVNSPLHADCEKRIEELNNMILEKNRLLEERSAELLALNKEKLEQRKFYVRVNEQFERFNKEKKEKEEKSENNIKEIARLTAIVNSHAGPSYKTQCECESLRQRLSAAKEENGKLNAMLTETQKQLAEQTKKVSDEHELLRTEQSKAQKIQETLKSERDENVVKFTTVYEKYNAVKEENTKLEQTCAELVHKTKQLDSELEQARQNEQDMRSTNNELSSSLGRILGRLSRIVDSNAADVVDYKNTEAVEKLMGDVAQLVEEGHTSREQISQAYKSTSDERNRISTNLQAMENVIEHLYKVLNDEGEQQDLPKSSSGGLDMARIEAVAHKTKEQAKRWHKLHAKLTTEWSLTDPSETGLDAFFENLKREMDAIKIENEKLQRQIIGNAANQFHALMMDYDQLSVENAQLRQHSSGLIVDHQNLRARVLQLQHRLREFAPGDPLLLSEPADSDRQESTKNE